MKTTHTPLSVARALRIGFAANIAKTWEQYSAQSANHGFWLNAYTAAKLVQEQVNGIGQSGIRNEPCSFQDASLALQEAIPELFAEFWEALA